jgi:hypothetical protein
LDFGFWILDFGFLRKGTFSRVWIQDFGETAVGPGAEGEKEGKGNFHDGSVSL